MKMKPVKNIDEFIGTYPPGVQVILQELRQTIHKAAPEATEKISYGIPTYYLNGNLVHFAGYKTHIGFYPGSAAIKKFEKDLKNFETSKGTIRLLIDKPLPLDLIRKVVLYRVKANQAIFKEPLF